MLMIHCPFCKEKREEEEFSYVGEANLKRPENIDDIDARAFARYLYFRDNKKGQTEELWVHALACRKYFKVIRDTESYEIIATTTLKMKATTVPIEEKKMEKSEVGA